MKRTAIILVAGMGTRLKPLTENNHKCLTEINGKPILINTLENLSKNGFEKVVLVVGYLKELIYEKIGEEFEGIKIEYVNNDIYRETNTSYSLKLGIDRVKDDDEIFIFEGDVMFENRLLTDFIASETDNMTVLEKYNILLDGTFVTLDANNNVIAWTHKSKRTKGYILEDKYKTVNIHKFRKVFVNEVLIPYLDEVVANSRGREPLETVMNLIVQKNSSIKGFIVDSQKWFEIDDLNDLKKAEEIFS